MSVPPTPPPWTGGSYWVFAYGSLIWNPGFAFAEQRPARAFGWHRRFCLYSHRYRGTPQQPGLVLGLDRGGSCHGLAYRIAPDQVEAVRSYLWQREMISDAYHPRMIALVTDEGTISAQTFTIRRDHGQYAGHHGEDEVACLIATSHGERGCNRSYLENTIQALTALGFRDHSLERLLRRVTTFQHRGCPPRPAHPVFDVGV
ncbi:MAG: gamma-glutamylcyclotransferase [Alphaproteobacteria bacterium]|nr:gamma-glutamylcyclotransferase [Alphaproteobacteria bacterium]